MITQPLRQVDRDAELPLSQLHQAQGQCVRVLAANADRTYYRVLCVTHHWRGPVEDRLDLAEQHLCGVVAARLHVLNEMARRDSTARACGITHADELAALQAVERVHQ